MPILQVYEHETLKVGDVFTRQHLAILSKRLGDNDEYTFPFFSLVNGGVKFKQYVGAIQVKDLTIEILPKTDRDTEKEKQYWKKTLLFMLGRVHKLNVSVSDVSSQTIQKSSILDYILIKFLDETEEILHNGLIKTYRTQDENLNTLKGRIIVSKQIAKNLIHKERFYVRHTVYDRSHIMNRIICQTLICIMESTTNPQIRLRASKYLAFFPEFNPIIVNEQLFAKLEFNRKTEGYREAISLSELILFNNMPNLTAGKKDSLAVLFDMNRLWEEFVYITLKKYLPEKYTVSAQVQKPFWRTGTRNKIIKPDIVVKEGEILTILDTKWKRPDKWFPDDSDLHQMYVYYRYFGANRVALIYPSDSDSSLPIYSGAFTDKDSAACDVMLLPVHQIEESGVAWQKRIAETITRLILRA